MNITGQNLYLCTSRIFQQIAINDIENFLYKELELGSSPSQLSYTNLPSWTTVHGERIG